MAEKQTTSTQKASDQDLQEEFDNLKSQVSDLMLLLKAKGQQKTASVKGDLNEQFADYEDKIKEQISHVSELGAENLEKVSSHVQKKPVASMLIAFGVGYLLSKTMSNK